MNCDLLNTINTVNPPRIMHTLRGSIWTLSTLEDTIVIPTNVGWKYRDGKNPMGKGLAQQAARRFRFLPEMYGTVCKTHKAATPLIILRVNRWCRYLLLLPTKELDVERPYLSWMRPTNPDALACRLQALEHHAQTFRSDNDPYPYYRPGRRILIPSLGCGYGSLPHDCFMQLTQAYLHHPAFVHVIHDEE